MTVQAAPSPSHLPPSPRQRPSRAAFWIGFVIGFALLALASCGGVALSLGLNRLSLSDLRSDNASWTPPTLAPTPQMPIQPELTPAPVGAFSAGQSVRNVTGSRVNVRATPGHLGKSPGDVLMQLAPGDRVVILGDSTLADNLTWWRVQVNGIEGWVAEATASGVQILGE